jgi:hypothetical protein
LTEIFEKLIGAAYQDRSKLDFEIDSATEDRIKVLLTKIYGLPGHEARHDSYVKGDTFVCMLNMDSITAELNGLTTLLVQSMDQKGLKQGVPMDERKKRSVKAISWLEAYDGADNVNDLEKKEYYEYLIFDKLPKAEMTVSELNYIIEELTKDSILKVGGINKNLRKEDKLLELQGELCKVNSIAPPDTMLRKRNNFSGEATHFVNELEKLNVRKTEDRIDLLSAYLLQLKENANLYTIPILDRVCVQLDIPIQNVARNFKVNTIISHIKQKYDLPPDFLAIMTADISGSKRKNRIDEDEQIKNPKRPPTTRSSIIVDDLEQEDDPPNLDIVADRSLGDETIEDILIQDRNNRITESTTDTTEDMIESTSVRNDKTTTQEGPQTTNNRHTRQQQDELALIDTIPKLLRETETLDKRLDSSIGSLFGLLLNIMLNEIPNLNSHFSIEKLNTMCHSTIHHVVYSDIEKDIKVYLDTQKATILEPLPFCSNSFCHTLKLEEVILAIDNGKICTKGQKMGEKLYTCMANLVRDRLYCERAHSKSAKCQFEQSRLIDGPIFFNEKTAILDTQNNMFFQNIMDEEFIVELNDTKYVLAPANNAYLRSNHGVQEFYLSKDEIASSFDIPDTILTQLSYLQHYVPHFSKLINGALAMGSIAGILSLVGIIKYIIDKLRTMFENVPHQRTRKSRGAIYHLGQDGIRRVGSNTDIELE